jgi:hypothetical protein
VLWLTGALLAGAAVLAAIRLFEGENVLLDLWDEWRLRSAALARLDEAAAARPRAGAIVCLTSTPSRLAHVDDTLKSLLRQTRVPKEIRLYLPTYSRREQRAYDIPARLRGLRNVTLHECDDLGPGTKISPALRALAPGQLLIAVDDDRIYPRDLVARLEEAANRAEAAYGLGGWIAPPDLVDRPTSILSNLLQRPPAPVRATRLGAPRRVDVLQGLAGYAVRPRFFDLERLADFSAAPAAARMVDDVWISAHCRVPKYVLPAARVSFEPWRRRSLYARTALGRLNRATRDEDRANSVMLRHFASRWDAGQRP